MSPSTAATDPGWPDLAAADLGALVLAANDEFFAPKENLLLPGAPVFDPEAYTDRGKLMDGWETRRRRTPGVDWCVVRLGVPGVLRQAVIDTAFFRGNYPQACSLEGCLVDGDPAPDRLVALSWEELLVRTPLKGDAEQVFPLEGQRLVSHVRFTIHPDGGVARLRLRGEAAPDLRALTGPDTWADVAATTSGGRVVACSDAFFSSPHHLLAPGSPAHMGGGWETRRRRGPGHDWVVVRLAAEAELSRVEVDTTHFKGNYPDRCTVELAHAPGLDPSQVPPDDAWHPVVPPAPMRAHARHAFRIDGSSPATHLRLGIHPDGGVARLRAYGRVTEQGWRAWGARWLSALPSDQLADDFRACCASQRWVQAMMARRPFATFDALLEAADAVWRGLEPADWREAFVAHPRIGERGAGGWAEQEQAGTAAAASETLTALEEGNRVYEERFGHVFLICASGLSAEQMLAALRERLPNEPATEEGVAAEEQRKITRLRLQKLVHP